MFNVLWWNLQLSSVNKRENNHKLKGGLQMAVLLINVAFVCLLSCHVRRLAYRWRRLGYIAWGKRNSKIMWAVHGVFSWNWTTLLPNHRLSTFDFFVIRKVRQTLIFMCLWGFTVHEHTMFSNLMFINIYNLLRVSCFA